MNSDTVVLDINSDDEEEVSCGVSDENGGGDDHNWLTKLLDEVDRDNGNSDDAMVVSEAVVNPKQRLKTAGVADYNDDSDDECVILDDDPDKPAAVRKYDDDDGGCDSDELVVVSEKGQVACRDYPHPRHLCARFPFSSTPHERHCDQCHCYVCESLAPCVHWGAGSCSINHCHATEKVEFWRLQRNRMRTGDKVFVPSDASVTMRLPQMNDTAMLPAPLQLPDRPNDSDSRPTSLRACSMSTNFPGPNIVNQTRSHHPGYSEPRNRFQPNLVSQHLLSTCNSTNPRDRRHNSARSYLGPQFARDSFKRTSSTEIPFKTKSYYSSSIVPHSPLHFRSQLPTHPTADSHSDNPVPSETEVTPCPNGDPTSVYLVPSEYQVSARPNHSVPSQLQISSLTNFAVAPESQVSPQSNYLVPLLPPTYHVPLPPPTYPVPLPSPTYHVRSQPNYMVPSQAPLSSVSTFLVPSVAQLNSHSNDSIFEQRNQTQIAEHTVFSDFDFNWFSPPRESGHQSPTKNFPADGAAPISEVPLVGDPGLADGFQYDSWIFKYQPVEPASFGVSLSSRLNGISPEPGIVDRYFL